MDHMNIDQIVIEPIGLEPIGLEPIGLGPIDLAQTRVLLVGGPQELSEMDRIREVATPLSVVKLPFGNGYHHFAYSGESHDLNGATLPVFRWCYQTKIAE